MALLRRRDTHHHWAVTQASRASPPWKTCEAALSEAFHLLGKRGAPALSALIGRSSVVVAFELAEDVESSLALMHKYRNLSMSLADACLVRMTEIIPDPMILTTDSDFGSIAVTAVMSYPA